MNRLHLLLFKVAFGAILLFAVASSAVYAQVTYNLTGTLNLVSGSDPLGLNGQVVSATATISQSMAPSSSLATATSSSNTYSGVAVNLAGLSCSTTAKTAVTDTLADNVGAADT